jgi:phage recombination protein Bet
MEANGTVTAITRAAAPEWSDEQKNLIKRTVAEGATDAELAMFLHVAKKAGLDPLQKQIWFVKRKQNVGTRENPKWEERVTIQAGVDGLQARALRQPDCEGIQAAAVYDKDDFVFDMKTGEVVRHVGNPFAARGAIVGAWSIVKRAGKMPFVALVRYAEYVDERSFLWKNKPAVMIEKVARSTALRRAYPEDFGGIYDPAEMGKDAAHDPAEAREDKPVEPSRPAPAVEVLPPEPKPAALPPKAQRMAPPYVLSLWNRTVAMHGGSKELARKAYESAARAVFGETPKPSNDWTEEDALNVESHIMPSDVP